MKSFILFTSIFSIFASQIVADDRFSRDHRDRVVINSETNQMWQDDEDSKNLTMSQIEAKNYCKNLKLAGYDNWRLPDDKEVRTIINASSRSNTSIYKAFKNVASNHYWTSQVQTIDKKSVGKAISFNSGAWYTSEVEHKYNVRCVRDIKK